MRWAGVASWSIKAPGVFLPPLPPSSPSLLSPPPLPPSSPSSTGGGRAPHHHDRGRGGGPGHGVGASAAMRLPRCTSIPSPPGPGPSSCGGRPFPPGGCGGGRNPEPMSIRPRGPGAGGRTCGWDGWRKRQCKEEERGMKRRRPGITFNARAEEIHKLRRMGAELGGTNGMPRCQAPSA